jgi:hypothetical protein|tara:strand:+ start:276 stop:962 length:687 start_codon:yes stop_codon:yes gene_type:complete
MKLSESTVEVLKNFATINQSILFTDGKELNTVAVQKNLLGSATVAETFKSPNGEFAIYDLNEFLSTLSLFEDPDVEFGEQFATISDSRANTVYWFADKEIIVFPTSKIEMPDSDVEFTLTAESLDKLQRATGTLGVPDLVIRRGESDPSKIVAEVLDKRNDTSNTFSLEVGDYAGDANFKFYFLNERMKMLPGDYNVQISSKKISKLTSVPDGEVTYWIALEQDSTYE